MTGETESRSRFVWFWPLLTLATQPVVAAFFYVYIKLIKELTFWWQYLSIWQLVDKYIVNFCHAHCMFQIMPQSKKPWKKMLPTFD